MRAVNLLPRDAHRGGRITAQQLPVVVGASVGVVVVATLAGGYLMAASKVATAQHALDAANAQLAATPLPPAPKPVKTTPQPTEAASELQPRLQAVAQALGQRIAWDRVLREFSLVLPDDVWISSLALQAPSATSGSSSSNSGFSIAGSTYSYASVARLLSRLALVPDLTDVTLGGTSSGSGLVQFSASAGIKGAPAPPTTTAAPPPPPPATTDTTAAGSTG